MMTTNDSIQAPIRRCIRVLARSRMKPLVHLAAMVGMLALALGAGRPAATAAATTLTFAAEADARVQESNPATNYGSGYLRSDGGTDPDVESYLRFRVSGVAGTVQRATLRVYATEATTNGPAVYATGRSWTETGITWKTRPARTSSAMDNKSAIAANTWVEFTVSPAISGDGVYSFVLAPTSRDGVDFRPREAGANQPELVVTLADAASPTPTSSATPTVAPGARDTTPPTVAITAPASGTGYTSARTVDIVAASSDNVGVTRVEFYDNGVLQGSEDTAPFSYSWAVSSAHNGSHRWTAKAYDAAGNSTVSAAVDLTVNITTTPTASTTGAITASAETTPVPHSGDAADDPAVWIHPTDPALSTIIGTDKLGGLAVYDLSGKQLYYYSGIKPNNVDLRYNFLLGGQRVTLVTFSNRTDDSIGIYRVNATTRGLEPVAARTISAGIGLYGLCMYHSPSSGKYYVFDNDNNGIVQQWELYDTGAGKVDARKVRQFDVGATTEGCVADDELSHFYVAEEDVAIWKYGAEPGAGATRTQVDKAGSGGRLTQDIEGLAIYYAGNGRGYLLASSQGSNSFVIYERQGSNGYVTTFGVSAGSVDAVTYTDGIDVTNFGLGSAFPEGLFVAQDDRNDGGNQNFKLVPWRGIARTGSPDLTVDTSWDPRRIGQ